MSKSNEKAREYRGEILRALTAHQARLIDAIAARIFPTTDTPGAVEAGAVFYVDRALADAYPELLPFYSRGLRAVATFSRPTSRLTSVRATSAEMPLSVTAQPSSRSA